MWEWAVIQPRKERPKVQIWLIFRLDSNHQQHDDVYVYAHRHFILSRPPSSRTNTTAGSLLCGIKVTASEMACSLKRRWKSLSSNGRRKQQSVGRLGWFCWEISWKRGNRERQRAYRTSDNHPEEGVTNKQRNGVYYAITNLWDIFREEFAQS